MGKAFAGIRPARSESLKIVVSPVRFRPSPFILSAGRLVSRSSGGREARERLPVSQRPRGEASLDTRLNGCAEGG